MDLPTRESVKILLLNKDHALLLMHIDDPKTTSPQGDYYGSFWTPIGGAIEKGETLRDAALREIHEETGISGDACTLGPVVWYGEFDLILGGELMHIKQTYLVAQSEQNNVSLSNLTQAEKGLVQKLKWFSLQDLQMSDEIFFPVVLIDYLPDILEGNLPKRPLEIDLGKQPKRK